MKLILVRHSKTKQEPDISPNLWGLSSEGEELSKQLASNTIWKDIDLICSSNQLKALETAIPIAKLNSIPIKVYENLTEITSFTIKTFEEDYKKCVNDFYTIPNKSYFGGETLEIALKRFNKAIELIIQENRDKTVAVVSHNNILTVFLKQFSKNDYLTIHDNMPMPSFAILNRDSKIIEKEFLNA